MVIDEANLETHGLGGKLDHDAQWTSAYLERVSRMAFGDKNHPSIIMWSLGNEAGSGPNHAAMAGWIKDFDMTRPLHYEPAMGSPKEEGYIDPSDPRYLKSNDHSHRIQNPVDQYYVDVISRMYPAMYTAPLLAGQPNGDHVLFSFASMLMQWETVREPERILGSVEKDSKDHWWMYLGIQGPGALKKDSAGVAYYAYGGDFGEKYFDNFTIKGMVAADGRPKAAMYECKRIFQPVQCEWADSLNGLVRIINRSEIKNVNRYNAVLEVKEDGKAVLNKLIGGIDIPPASNTTMDISRWLPVMRPGAEYHVALHFILINDEPWAGKGFEIAGTQLRIKKPTVMAIAYSRRGNFTVNESIEGIRIDANNFSMRVGNVVDGGLASYIYKGKEQLFSPVASTFQKTNDR